MRFALTLIVASLLTVTAYGQITVSGTVFTNDVTASQAISSTTCNAGVASQTGCAILAIAGQRSVAVSWPAGGTGIETFVVEFANDSTGTTWTASNFDGTTGKVATVTTVNANTAYLGTLVGVGGARYVRVRASAFTSGSTTITITGSQLTDPSVLFAAADGATVASPTLAQMGGIVGTAAPTYVSGQQKEVSLDVGGRQRVKNAQDEGRTAISFYTNNFASGTTTTEKIITWDQSKGTGAITSATASYTITNGKTLRITGLLVASRGHATATIQSTVFNLRLNTGGACIVSSTPILFAAQSATPATASAWDRIIIPIPDGYEIAGNGTIALCISAAATFTTNAPTWSVNLIGYEY